MTNPRTGSLTWLAIAPIVAIGLMIAFGAVTMNTYGGYCGMMGSGSWAWGLVMMGVPGVILVLILLAAGSRIEESRGGTSARRAS